MTRGSGWLWAFLTAALALGAVVLVAAAVRDLAADPSFAGVLRLVVEAVVGTVLTVALWRRSGRSRRTVVTGATPATPPQPPPVATRPEPPEPREE